jgi:glycosyltransferase involved in cell wall biosynthesis
MKITIITCDPPSAAGGSEIVWNNLKNYFKFKSYSLKEESLPFFIKILPNHFHIKEIVASKKLMNLASRENSEFLIYDKIFGWPKIKTKAIKICYNHGSYTIAGLKFKKKNFFIYLFYKYVLSYFEKKSYENANKIIAVSESVKNEMIRYFKIPEKKIVVIDNGVDLNKFKPIKNKVNLRKKYGLPVNKRILFFPGRPSFGKGFDIAKNVIKRLGNSYLLLVLGDKKGGETNIRDIGKVDNNHISEIYNLADICLFPSRYEGNSLSVLESASCATPLILSNEGFMKDSLEMKEYLCSTPENYTKKIKKILQNKRNLNTAKKDWLKFSKRNSLDKQARELKNFLGGLNEKNTFHNK